MAAKRGLVERLDAGELVIGDGGFLFCMEKRGYVKAGQWTPECTVEYPDAVRQLHREFLHAGADVMQTFTFYASDDKLSNRGNKASEKIGCEAVNQAACDLAKEVANEGGALVAGNVCNTPSYLAGKGKEAVQAELKKQLDVFVKNDVDFMIGELFLAVEEAEWAVEVMKETRKPLAITLTASLEGDFNGVPIQECALRLARTGADVIGVNCYYDPDVSLAVLRVMKEALDKEGIKKPLMIQPIGFKTPECYHSKYGFTGLQEFPFALESRILTRWDVHRFAREAYDLGVRYIGGCCGFEPYHIRAISEELGTERGKFPKASEKHSLWGDALRQHNYPWVRARATRSFWENVQPSSGRPYSSAYRKCEEGWDTVAGHKDITQTKELTTDNEVKELGKRAQGTQQ